MNRRMGTIIERLATWARDLSYDDLPRSVRERVRLQHLSAAGAIKAVADRPFAEQLRRAGGTRGKAALVGGKTAPQRDALRLHMALGTLLDHDDHLVFGPVGIGATAGAWAAAKGHTVRDLHTATVAANEVAGRVGASLIFGPSPGAIWSAVHAAGVTTALGLLEGLDSDELAHALALALAVPRRVPLASQLGGGLGKGLIAAGPAVQAVDAVAMAKEGAKGPLSLLDDRDGLLGALTWVPLRNAYTGLGKAWLTETLAFGLMPVSPFFAVPVQAVHEILMRHVKAADKRLRVNQVDRIELSVSAPTFNLAELRSRHPSLAPGAVSSCLRTSIGVLVAEHSLGPAELTEGFLARKHDAITEVASKVEISHDWDRTLDLVEHVVDVLGPLLAGVTSAELRTAGLRATGTYGRLPLGGRDLLMVLRRRPGQLMERLRYQTGDLSEAPLEQWQFRYGAEVKVYTTRGGNWPERRDVAWGSPGWDWSDSVGRVHAKFAGAGADEEALAAAEALGKTDLSADATGYVKALLAR